MRESRISVSDGEEAVEWAVREGRCYFGRDVGLYPYLFISIAFDFGFMILGFGGKKFRVHTASSQA